MDENDDGDLASQYGVVTDAEGAAHPAAEMAPPPPPPAPEPFTQADSLRLQKLQVGMSQAQEQMDDGTLSADEGHQLLQNIQALATPLALKQKRATEQAKQEQAGDLMQQSAQLQAIDQANKVHSAQGFQDRVSTYTDAMTGKTVHLIEDGGKVRELDFSKAADAAQEGDGPTFQGQANGYYPLASAVGYEDPANPFHTLQTDANGIVSPAAPGLDGQPGDLPRDKGPRTQIGDAYAAQGAPDQQGAAPGTPQVQPAADGGHTMTIQNGARVEKWHFAPDGTTTKVADSQPPPQAQGPMSAVQLNPAELGILKHNAQQVVGPPKLTGNPRVDQQLVAQNQLAVNSLFSHFAQAEMKRRQSEVNANAFSARQQTGIEAKKQAQEERLAAQKERKEQEESADKLIDMAGKQLETERGRWTDKDTGQLRDGAPKYLTDPALFDQEVTSRVQRHRNLRQGILGGPAPSAPAGAAPAGPPPEVQAARQKLLQQIGGAPGGDRTEDDEAPAVHQDDVPGLVQAFNAEKPNSTFLEAHAPPVAGLGHLNEPTRLLEQAAAHGAGLTNFGLRQIQQHVNYLSDKGSRERLTAAIDAARKRLPKGAQGSPQRYGIHFTMPGQ